MNEESASSSPWIVETTDATFERDVFERSREVPVVVDFWADWCQPCRLLAPLLEELARERQGEFILVKADTAQCPQAAGGFQVNAIPTVYAVVDGQAVDFFQGILPRRQLEAWLERPLLQGRLLRAAAWEQSRPEEAERLYRQVMHELPNESAAPIGLARLLLAQGRPDEAGQLLALLERRGFLEPEAEKIKAQLELRGMAADDLDALRAACEQAPDDLAGQLQLAEALAAAGEHQEALDRCLALVERDRHGVGETARQVMVDLFRVLPDDSPLVADYRRKLAMALY